MFFYTPSLIPHEITGPFDIGPAIPIVPFRADHGEILDHLWGLRHRQLARISTDFEAARRPGRVGCSRGSILWIVRLPCPRIPQSDPFALASVLA